MTDVPFIALTASAPPDIKEVIVVSLHLKSLAIVCRTLDRPNIFFSISKSTTLEVSAIVCGSKLTIGLFFLSCIKHYAEILTD